jgi:hypothetical protein
MNINLSKSEIQALLVALKHTQNFQQSDAALDEDRFRTENAPGTVGWLQRKDAAEELSEKLTKVLASDEAKAERMMKGTASPVDVDPLCPNDPVNW